MPSVDGTRAIPGAIGAARTGDATPLAPALFDVVWPVGPAGVIGIECDNGRASPGGPFGAAAEAIGPVGIGPADGAIPVPAAT